MTNHIRLTTITDFATGREAQALTLTVAGRTEYASVSDAWGAAIARLMEDLDRAQKRIAAIRSAFEKMDAFAVKIHDVSGDYYSVRARDFKALWQLHKATAATEAWASILDNAEARFDD